jgi:tetratricopeptide (TPR) repeat protein
MKGYALYNLQRYDESITCYDKVLEINPNYANAWYNKGISLDSLEKYEEAIKAYDKAIEIDPKNIYAWHNKGNAFYNLGKYDEAINCYDRLLEIDPNYADAWLRKGTALTHLEKYNEGIASYDKAIEINPDSLDTKASLAEALLISKDYSKSERLAKEVIDRTDDKILVYVMHLLIVCSLYMRGSMSEGGKETLDLLNYFESVPTDSEYDWSFDDLKEMINYDSRLSKDEKEIISLLILLPETKAADYRLNYINEIRNLIGK